MEALNTWCRIVSLVSVASAVFMLVIPESKLKSGFKTLVALILAFSFLSPLKGGKEELFNLVDSISYFDAEYKSREINDYSITPLKLAVQNETEAYLEETVRSLGIEIKCRAECDYDGEKIIIRLIDISGEITAEDKILIFDKIREITGEETEVRFDGEYYERN